jgi:hypothetical protein
MGRPPALIWIGGRSGTDIVEDLQKRRGIDDQCGKTIEDGGPTLEPRLRVGGGGARPRPDRQRAVGEWRRRSSKRWSPVPNTREEEGGGCALRLNTRPVTR